MHVCNPCLLFHRNHYTLPLSIEVVYRVITLYGSIDRHYALLDSRYDKPCYFHIDAIKSYSHIAVVLSINSFDPKCLIETDLTF